MLSNLQGRRNVVTWILGSIQILILLSAVSYTFEAEAGRGARFARRAARQCGGGGCGIRRQVRQSRQCRGGSCGISRQNGGGCSAGGCSIGGQSSQGSSCGAGGCGIGNQALQSGGCGAGGCGIQNQALLQGVQGGGCGINGCGVGTHSGGAGNDFVGSQHPVLTTLDQTSGVLRHGCNMNWNGQTAPICLDLGGQTYPVLYNNAGRLVIARGSSFEELNSNHAKPLLDAYNASADPAAKTIAAAYDASQNSGETPAVAAQNGAADVEPGNVASQEGVAKVDPPVQSTRSYYEVGATALARDDWKAELERVMAGNSKGRIIFTASWCGPCQTLKALMRGENVTATFMGQNYNSKQAVLEYMGVPSGENVYFVDADAVGNFEKANPTTFEGRMYGAMNVATTAQAAASRGAPGIPALLPRPAQQKQAPGPRERFANK